MTTKSNTGLIPDARARLDDATWAYLVGGSGTESTLRRNRMAYERLAFSGFVLRDVTSVDATTTMLGVDLRIPVITAPVGTLGAFHRDGAEGVARACAEFGILHVAGMVGQTPAQIAESGHGPTAYQLYRAGDRDWLRARVEAIHSADLDAIVFTVDVASRARRERQMLAGSPFDARVRPDRHQLASASWADVEMLRATTHLPIIIKGVQRSEDALRAVDAGVDGVWISNHGGRQLDHSRSSLDALAEISTSLSEPGVALIVDGGIQTGSDVLKALALGADVVAVGRLQCLALAIGGSAGVRSMLEVLEDEIVTQMGLLGVTELSQVDRSVLVPVEPLDLPDSTDAWSAIR